MFEDMQSGNMSVDDPFLIPDSSGEDWKKMTSEKQNRYNQKVAAKNEYIETKENYDTSITNLISPVPIIAIGIIFAIFLHGGIILDIIIILIGILWAILRIAAYLYAYERHKRAKAALKNVIAELSLY
ncbi:hypothetical protein [Methanoregula sp.]|jgi:hypothetical protein|uniref:hypothetical protein n=1 Tax=Methanoregula sp. TaxID=2052170 RepID=UPI003C1321EA